ncbi:MAG: efflux RND transporter periplasmic adaptor subunit [Deltaproteobacteria bacterium]|nr:efflux RND transporter periplasmic adaptor subunit [Deltaproteobacteria bacterium]
MTLTAYPGEVFIGEVSFIYPFMEAKTRTNKVRLVFKNTELKLKPDMYSNITIKTVIGKNITVVPTEAVIRSGERNIVIVTVGEGKFMAKEIVLGAEAEGYYEIKEGVNEGEVIVTSAQFLIDSESKLKEAISKMLSESPEENMDHDDMEHDGMTHEDMNHEDMSHDEMVHDDMGHEEEVSDEMNHESMGHDL